MRQLAGLVMRDHQFTVEGLDPELPAVWQRQPVPSVAGSPPQSRPSSVWAL